MYTLRFGLNIKKKHIRLVNGVKLNHPSHCQALRLKHSPPNMTRGAHFKIRRILLHLLCKMTLHINVKNDTLYMKFFRFKNIPVFLIM